MKYIRNAAAMKFRNYIFQYKYNKFRGSTLNSYECIYDNDVCCLIISNWNSNKVETRSAVKHRTNTDVINCTRNVYCNLFAP